MHRNIRNKRREIVKNYVWCLITNIVTDEVSNELRTACAEAVGTDDDHILEIDSVGGVRCIEALI